MDANDLLKALSDTADGVAAMTGVKAQFIEAGWSEPNAELMVLEMLRASNKAT